MEDKRKINLPSGGKLGAGYGAGSRGTKISKIEKKMAQTKSSSGDTSGKVRAAQAKASKKTLGGKNSSAISNFVTTDGFRTSVGGRNLTTMKNNWKQGERVRFEKNAWDETKAHRDREASPKVRASRGLETLKKKVLKGTKRGK